MRIIKRDAHGHEVLSYEGTLIERGEKFVCIQAKFGGATRDLGYVVFKYGDHFTEWFYSDRWYNVFRVQDVDSGALKGWYCNITRPAEITENSVAADDLALDVFISPDGETLVLDEDEFMQLSLPDDERQQARAAVVEIKRLAANAAGPFYELAS